MDYIGVRGCLAPNGVFFSCVRCGGESGAQPASVRACVRASVRACVRPPPLLILTPQKRQKPFKINGLGVFLGSPLGRQWARTRFFDPPLVAQHGPSESIKNVVKPMHFWCFVERWVRRERPQREPQSTKCLKCIGKMTISDTFTGPMMGHQWTIKKTPPGPQWPQIGAKENAQTVYFKRFFAFFRVR